MAVADRLSTSYIDGVGVPVVFLHGWLGSIDSWKQVRKELDIPNPLLFYDQRCHGGSPCEEFDFDDLAQDLHALVEVHGFEDPVLVAHSMGGMVALTYAVNHDNLGGLLLFGTCASTPEPGLESPKFYLDNFHEMDRRQWSEMIADNYLGDRDVGLREGTVKELMAADEE
ncbi:MAG: alpha/beta fold hydrolase, partial [Candidatus Nanohaloarchaea archaeon]